MDESDNPSENLTSGAASQSKEPDASAGDTPATPPAPEASSEAPAAPRARGRSAYATRDLTRGNVRRNLWFLAWPQVTEGALTMVDQLADLLWAGRLGFQAIAGLGVAQIIVMVAMTARMGLESSMRAMISRAIGARDVVYANHVLQQSLLLQTGLALAMIDFGFTLTEPILRLLGVSDSVIGQAGGYTKFQFVAMSMMGFQRTMGGSLQAAGDSMTQLKAISLTRVVHLGLSPVLVFGLWIFPDLGLTGMAIANLAAQVTGTTVVGYALLKGTSRLKLTFRGARLDLPLLGRLVRVGAPASVTNVQRGLSQLAIISIVAPFGDGALAAFALTRRAENVINHGARGFGRAAGALAGQNLGAGQVEEARSSVQWALAYSAGSAAVIAALFILFPDRVTSFFNSDAEFVNSAVKWLSVLAVGYVSMSCVQVFTQSFNTTGNTVAPMLVTMGTMWGIEVPLAFGLSRVGELGQFGIPWATVTASLVRLLVFVWYFKKGRWLKTGMI